MAQAPIPASQLADAVDFAFAVATDKLSARLATADQVDTKLRRKGGHEVTSPRIAA